jgi:fibronectin-binding autotransporter adhesin
MPRTLLVALCVAILAVLGLGSSRASAATWTWDGGAPAGNQWTNTLNWNPDTAPDNGTADIIFGGTIRLMPDMNALWSVNSVTFNNTAGPFQLNSLIGETLIIGAGGITNNDTDTQAINHAIALFAPQTWSAASGPLFFSISAPIQNNGHMTIDGAFGTSIDGIIQGSGGLTKNGLGSLFLQGSVANSYAGTTTVNAGLLELSGSVVVAIPGALEIGDGVGTAIDTVVNRVSHKIADSATVSVFSTGAWNLNDPPFVGSFTTSETITNLNIVSTGIAGGGAVTFGKGALFILGNMTMTGGTVRTTGTGALVLAGNLTTNAADITASISSKLDLVNGPRTFTIADGAAPNDLDVTGVVSNGGIIKNGPGTLRLGEANTYAGGTTLNAGTILIGHDSALGTGPLTANGGAFRADGATRTIANAVNGTFAVVGEFDLDLSSPLNGNITKNGPGTLVFVRAGAITNSLTLNAGAVRVDAAVTFAGGLTNSGTVLFGTQTLTVNGAGLNNQGSLPLAGGTLAGSGPVVNNGLIAGTGTIGGTGGLTNNAQLTVSGGNLTLANAGANANAGNVEVAAGLQLRLTGGTLANTGTVDLAGGGVAGTATLSNNAGGIVSGRGLISAPFTNAGGTLRAVGGTMNVTSAFTNSGVIRLDDAAGLAGGAITNTGLIQGDGTLSNALTNSSTGSIRVDVGRTLFFTGTFAPNAGELNLQGGTLDFTGAVTNSATGFIAGRGALYTGGLTNNGQMAFSGGNSDIHGDVTNSLGAISTAGGGGLLTFFDDVVNQGQIRTNTGSRTVIFGDVSGSGSFPGAGTVEQLGDTRPGNSPAVVSYGGNLVFGDTSRLSIEIGGTTPGDQYDRLTIAGNATLGGDLLFEFIDGFAPRQGDAFEFLDAGGMLSGSFDEVEVRNLAPGFQFDLRSDGGGMAMVALNDGVFVIPPANTWNVDANGTWSSAANWTVAVPNRAGAAASFGSKITAPRTVTADVPITVGRIDFDNANTYTLAGSNTITLNATSGDAQINVTSGSHTISAPVSLAGNTLITVSPAAGNLSITGALSGGAVNLTKAGAGSLTLNNLRAAGLSINEGTLVVNGSITSATTVNTGATLGGSGTVGAVTIKRGGIVAPGNRLGRLTAGDTRLEGGGKYLLDLRTDGAGVAGVDWDSLAVNGTLDISALTAASPFIFRLQTLDAANNLNSLAVWDRHVSHTWDSVLSTVALSGGDFDARLFRVDATDFKNQLSGTFSVVQEGTNFNLQYDAAQLVTWTGDGGNGNWSNLGNWSRAVRPTTGNRVVFGSSTQTNVRADFSSYPAADPQASDQPALRLESLTFDAVAPSHTIELYSDASTSTIYQAKLEFDGAGVINTSGQAQTFTIDGGPAGRVQNGSSITFKIAASAGNASYHAEGGLAGGTGGIINFHDESTAGNGAFTNNGGTVESGSGGATKFTGNSTAANGVFTNNGGTTIFALGGQTIFGGASTAGLATITNAGPTGLYAFHGRTSFFESASAGNATITNLPSSGGPTTTDFYGKSTAASATIINKSGPYPTVAGVTTFHDSSSAGNGTFINESNSGGTNGQFTFNDFSTAGQGTFTDSASVSYGYVTFNDNSTAGQANIIVRGPGDSRVMFFEDSSAGAANIDVGPLAFAPVNVSNLAQFFGNSTAANSTITVRGDGGSLSFAGSTAGNATIVALGSTRPDNIPGTVPGQVLFNSLSTAGNATITAQPATVAGAPGGSIVFLNGGRAGAATLIANGGATDSNGGGIRFQGAGTGGSARLVVNAGAYADFSLNASHGGTAVGSIEGAGRFSLGASSLTVGNLNINTIVSGNITDSGGYTAGTGGRLTKVGTGKLTLAGANTYSGLTTVEGGTLDVNGSIVGDAIVKRGGTLAGTGVIGGNTTVLPGGKLEPGNSPGTLTIGGNFTQELGSLLGIEFAGTAPGMLHDVLRVTGNVALGGDLLLEFIDGFAPHQGDVFEFLNVDGTLAGSFANVELRNLAPGFQFDLRPDAGGLMMVALNDGVFVPPPPSVWNVDANGNWSSAANWAVAVPNRAGAAAVFSSKITAPRSVTADVPITVGRIDFDSANAYTVDGSNTITLNATGGDAQINVASGSHTISAPVSLADDTLVTVAPAVSNLSITGTLGAGGVNLTKAGAGSLTLNNLRATGLSINAGTVAMAPGGTAAGTSVLGALSIAGASTPTAKLDVNNNAAIINYTGTSPAATVRQQLLAGRGGPGLGGTWTGQGVTSSAAATANVADAESRSVGYAENSALPLGPYTTFRGQPVDDTSLLMAFTRTGDANLDGLVNDDDVTIVGATYAPSVPQPSWALGDFDYNGFVDDDDVTLLGVFYNPSAAPIGVAVPADTNQVAAVPEPNAFLLLAIGALALALLRKRWPNRG